MVSDLLFMCDNNDRVAGFIQYFEKRHNLFPGSRVQVPSRFISQDN